MMANQHQDRFNPLPVFYPEVAKISVGFSDAGHLAVRVLATKGLAGLTGLQETFDRAAAAFMQEFGASEKLIATIRTAGHSHMKVNQITNELADRDGAAKVGYDPPTEDVS